MGLLALSGTTGWLELRDMAMVEPVTVTAHRGSSARAPENTLAAVQRAIADGAHVAEIDVQTTADGSVVVFHDAEPQSP